MVMIEFDTLLFHLFFSVFPFDDNRLLCIRYQRLAAVRNWNDEVPPI